MRLLLLYVSIFLITSCSKEAVPPPVIIVEKSSIDPDAAVIIQSLYSQASTSAQWQKLGMYYQAHGLDDFAIQAYEYAIALQPNSKASYLLGITYANLGFYEKAIESVSSVTNYIPALWQQGMWQLDLGNYSVAEKQFKKAIAKDPTTVAAIVGLARVYLSQNKFEESIRTLEDVINRGGKHQYLFYLLGKAHQQAGHAEIAKRYLGSTKSGQPKWDDPWIDDMRSHQRGFAAELSGAVRKIDDGNLQGALSDLKRIESRYPYTPDVQSNLAMTQLQLGQLNDAILTLGSALRKSPDYAPLHLTMAFAMSQAGETEKAIEFATHALSLQPSMVIASSFIGKMAMKQKNYPLAMKSFTTSLELGDSDPRTRELFAELHLRFGRWEDAIKQYNFVLQIAPNRTGSIGGLAIALANSGKKNQATQMLTVALQKNPGDQNLLRARNAIANIGESQ
jgi:tetratricopeptide (TPR) repeat protein